MTPSDIDSMPAGPEMDALVAERVFGVAPVEHGNFAGGSAGQRTEDGGLEPIPPYSTSDAAALEVAKKLMDSSTVWSIRNWTPNWCEANWYALESKAEGWGETLAIATCRAALKATLP